MQLESSLFTQEAALEERACSVCVGCQGVIEIVFPSGDDVARAMSFSGCGNVIIWVKNDLARRVGFYHSNKVEPGWIIKSTCVHHADRFGSVYDLGAVFGQHELVIIQHYFVRAVLVVARYAQSTMTIAKWGFRCGLCNGYTEVKDPVITSFGESPQRCVQCKSMNLCTVRT